MIRGRSGSSYFGPGSQRFPFVSPWFVLSAAVRLQPNWDTMAVTLLPTDAAGRSSILSVAVWAGAKSDADQLHIANFLDMTVAELGEAHPRLLTALPDADFALEMSGWKIEDRQASLRLRLIVGTMRSGAQALEQPAPLPGPAPATPQPSEGRAVADAIASLSAGHYSMLSSSSCKASPRAHSMDR